LQYYINIIMKSKFRAPHGLPFDFQSTQQVLSLWHTYFKEVPDQRQNFLKDYKTRSTRTHTQLPSNPPRASTDAAKKCQVDLIVFGQVMLHLKSQSVSPVPATAHNQNYLIMPRVQAARTLSIVVELGGRRHG